MLVSRFSRPSSTGNNGEAPALGGSSPKPCCLRHSTITFVLADRPKVSGAYISSALVGGTT